ncbi:MAG: hypothetical protein DWQ11_08260 [Proteobacteria bacterium]|nr:MAG: hypothetical protein DWQ11_08260 [Pseudomonadota bacterium]
MKPSAQRFALLLSVLLNLGVVAAIALDAMRVPAVRALPDYLALSADQRVRWQAAEGPFLVQFSAASHRLETHRTDLIRAIFADTVDPAAIEAERAQIAELQQAQQRLMIEQLLAERAMLDPAQRERLARLLLEQPGVPSALESLHRP